MGFGTGAHYLSETANVNSSFLNMRNLYKEHLQCILMVEKGCLVLNPVHDNTGQL